MEIVRVLNNNAILSVDENRNDIIVLGAGIAFQKKRGDLVDKSKIERIFSQDNFGLMTKLKKIFAEITPDYIEISKKIISCAKLELGKEYNENLYISLPED